MDLKPANILISKTNGYVFKIADFGLSTQCLMVKGLVTFLLDNQ